MCDSIMNTNLLPLNLPLYMCVCVFDLILYVPVNNLSVTSGWVFLGLNSTKLSSGTIT